MTAKTSLIEYVLAHGWNDDDVAALEGALKIRGDEAPDAALAILGERYCPAVETCELVTLLPDWSRVG